MCPPPFFLRAVRQRSAVDGGVPRDAAFDTYTLLQRENSANCAPAPTGRGQRTSKGGADSCRCFCVGYGGGGEEEMRGRWEMGR